MELHSCYMVSNEWDQLICIRDFLFRFKKATRAPFGIYYPTTRIPLYYLTEISRIFIENRHNSHLVNIVAPIEAKFNKYLHNFSYLIFFWHYNRQMH